MSDSLNGFANIYPNNQDAFQPRPYVDTGDVEVYNSIDICAGRWIRTNEIKEFSYTSNIGSYSNPFIIADWDTETIYATADEPDETDTNKKLLITLSYAVYSVEANEYPDNPSYDGQYAITDWKQHQFGDIDERGDVVFDADCDNPEYTKRRTLQKNPEAYDHEGEGQLYDVHTVKQEKKSMPFFDAGEEQPDSTVPGTLRWVLPDEQYESGVGVTPFRSLEISQQVYGDYIMSIYGFRTSKQFSCAMSEGAIDNMYVDWKFICRGPDYTTEVPGSISTQFVSGISSDSSANNFHVTMKYKENTLDVASGQMTVGSESEYLFVDLYGDIDWCDGLEELKDCPYWDQYVRDAITCEWLDDEKFTECGVFDNLQHKHEQHTFNYDDHDGKSGPGAGSSLIFSPRYLEVNSDETRNNMSGYIGDSIGNKVLYPSDRLLYAKLGLIPTIDFDLCELQGEGLADATNWSVLNGTRFMVLDDTPASIVPSEDAALQITGGLFIGKRTISKEEGIDIWPDFAYSSSTRIHLGSANAYAFDASLAAFIRDGLGSVLIHSSNINGTYQIDVEGTMADGKINVDGYYSVGYVPGQSITDWFTGGIFYGTPGTGTGQFSVKKQKDLTKNDEVLVRNYL